MPKFIHPRSCEDTADTGCCLTHKADQASQGPQSNEKNIKCNLDEVIQNTVIGNIWREAIVTSACAQVVCLMNL